MKCTPSMCRINKTWRSASANSATAKLTRSATSRAASCWLGEDVPARSGFAKSRDGELHMEFARDLPNIRVDDARVMQVLENLIDNAIRYSPPGSETSISSTQRWPFTP